MEKKTIGMIRRERVKLENYETNNAQINPVG